MFGGQAQYEEVDSLILPLAHRRVVKLKRGRKKSTKRVPMLTVRSAACFFIIKRQKKRDKKYVAPSTNVNNTLDFNNTAIVWKPSPAADLLLIELDPCRVPAFEPIIDQGASLTIARFASFWVSKQSAVSWDLSSTGTPRPRPRSNPLVRQRLALATTVPS